MSDFDTSAVVSAGTCAKCGYTPIASPVVNNDKEDTSYRLLLREILFERTVGRSYDMKRSVMRELLALDGIIRERKLLWLSSAELVAHPAFKCWERSRVNIHLAFAGLAARGYVNRSERDARGIRKTGGKVVVWSLSGKGKGLVRLYSEYLTGMHDDKLGY